MTSAEFLPRLGRFPAVRVVEVAAPVQNRRPLKQFTFGHAVLVSGLGLLERGACILMDVQVYHPVMGQLTAIAVFHVQHRFARVLESNQRHKIRTQCAVALRQGLGR